MLKSGSELRSRDLYLHRLIAFQDADPVKIITGIRRCGKSSLLKLMAQHLRNNDVTEEQIIELNFESMKFRRMGVETLYYTQLFARFPRYGHGTYHRKHRLF
ncbi:MAG: AAA family ATPase [Eubacteriales bacterium]|nr:AAA family ATPase [Eubacteriales bacterium]